MSQSYENQTVNLKILNNPWQTTVYLLVSACGKYGLFLWGLCLFVEVNCLCITWHKRYRTVVQTEINLKKKDDKTFVLC